MRDEFILRAANTHVFDIHQTNAADAKFRTVTDQSPVKRAHRLTREAWVAQREVLLICINAVRRTL